VSFGDKTLKTQPDNLDFTGYDIAFFVVGSGRDEEIRANCGQAGLCCHDNPRCIAMIQT
jgi:aspartate-semialdehyde dehydrogenase